MSRKEVFPLQDLIASFSRDKDFLDVVEGFRARRKEQQMSGLSGSARSLMLAALHQELGVPLVVVTFQLYDAQKMADDLREWLGPEHVLLYPVNEVVASDLSLSSSEMLEQRVATLIRLTAGFRGIVVLPYAGLRRLLPPRALFATAGFTLRRGQTFAFHELRERMVDLGYEHVTQVENKGEFCVRGGIVDFYPITAPAPYRVEFFDDEVDSIRMFQLEDQISKEHLAEIDVTPNHEWFATAERFHAAAGQAQEWLNRQLAVTNDQELKRNYRQLLGEEIEMLRERRPFPAMMKYIAFLYPERATLSDYLAADALLVLEQPGRLYDVARQMDFDESEWRLEMAQAGKMLGAFQWSKPVNEVLQGHSLRVLYNSLLLATIPNARPEHTAQINCHPLQNYFGNMPALKKDTDNWRKIGYQLVFMAASEERRQHMKRILYDFEIDYHRLLIGNLQSGFELPGVRLVVFTEAEVFHQKQRRQRPTVTKNENALSIKSYKELNVGDYVVHVHHGIGQYTGIGTLLIEGVHRDFMHINYAGGDRLSVPIDQIQLVQKYMGSDDRSPKIHRLGGASWERAKSKARSSAKNIADELIKLYAERQARQGHAFARDTPEQMEFESLFQYDETPDQLRSVKEIKEDMELTRPMDRLLCGDVGYGKTEVAIRAAFKAVMGGKQVALLVPTTILAQQHYKTFTERFADFPGQIEVLSRFRTEKEMKKTIENVRKGLTDIVIGTHRLLSKDVQFKSLGLLIVDEEQRFGVTHKEKLKKLKTNVDVLTLTATPIPRTLHMSLIGVRDLSVIETPPENRLPVQTYVVEHSYALVREVIERELNRGGQVFYMYNRVQGMESISENLRAILPDARIAVAHGQMPEQQLERTILDFLEGDYDVLISTSIIESGVDIPNVNTLIVHDADKLGLSQLYQLRGRVGRSAGKIAYAYFTYQRNKVLTEVAEKRLSAIKQFTELGSGFKLAMRDLSIRGAGNLLGAEQSGFIASIGFELYTQMLAEEIEERKLELNPDSNRAHAAPEAPAPEIEIIIDAYLPGEYIYDSKQKIEIYKRVAALESLSELEQLREEIRDRFGKLPQQVESLLTIAALKLYGVMYGISKFVYKNGRFSLFMGVDSVATPAAQLLEVLRRHQGSMSVLTQGLQKQRELQFDGKGLQVEHVLARVHSFLVEYGTVFQLRGDMANA